MIRLCLCDGAYAYDADTPEQDPRQKEDRANFRRPPRRLLGVHSRVCCGVRARALLLCIRPS